MPLPVRLTPRERAAATAARDLDAGWWARGGAAGAGAGVAHSMDSGLVERWCSRRSIASSHSCARQHIQQITWVHVAGQETFAVGAAAGGAARGGGEYHGEDQNCRQHPTDERHVQACAAWFHRRGVE